MDFHYAWMMWVLVVNLINQMPELEALTDNRSPDYTVRTSEVRGSPGLDVLDLDRFQSF